ncbi:protein TolQ [Formosimonas limnophila]|nr:protein TolQ [Formosimonas limnophila]
MNNSHNILSLILNASPVVQIIMAILVLISVMSWYTIFHKGATVRKTRAQTEAFEREFLAAQNLNHLFQGSLANRHQAGSLERIFVAGMQGHEQMSQQSNSPEATLEFAQRAMKAAYQRELDSLEAKLPFLASVGSVSPYIGLLGTVWGIMNAFMGLSTAEQSTLASVAPGIAEALIATALGLFAAIPAVLAYNRYVAEVDRLALRFESFIDDFSNTLSASTKA